MKKRWWMRCAVIALLSTLLIAPCGAQKPAEELPDPTHANLSYGSDSMNVMELWLVPSETPTPLLVFIHRGGFRGGDKRNFSSDLIKRMHREGISVASINYRLTKEGLLAEGKNMYPVPMHDGARALQFLRYHALKYNLEISKFAATGGSAGGCMLMWLGFHPDLAHVVMAQNRAGREIPGVTTIYPGKLPIGEDGIHYSSEGYIMLGKITASAVEELYKSKD